MLSVAGEYLRELRSALPRHASPPARRVPDLAVPARPCRAAVPARVHGGVVLAGLDTSRALWDHRSLPSRWSSQPPCSPHTTAYGNGAWCRAIARRAGVGCLRVAGGGVGYRGVTAPARVGIDNALPHRPALRKLG